jgi:Ala-tRNA(Pro) deacylase
MYVVDFLRNNGIWFEALIHQPASSSTKRAGNVHVPGRRVAKAVLVKNGDAFVLAVLPSTSRIDLARFSEVVGVAEGQVRLATPDEVCSLFCDCEPGAVPVFGRLYGLQTVVDTGLADSAEIVVVANTRHEGLRMLFRDFQSLEEPVRGSFSRPNFSGSDRPVRVRRQRKRRAG